jgi:putative MATE family efflux protein
MTTDAAPSMPTPDKATRRLLEGPLAWEVFRFGGPIALGMVLQTMFNLVDAYLIAQLSPGERLAAVGALGVCDQLAAIGTIVCYGVSTATATLIANQKGAGDAEGVRRTAWQSLIIVAVLSVLFGVLGMVAPAIVSGVIGLKGQVADVASRYLRVIMAGSFSIFFLLQMTSIQRALGSSKTPVALLALGNVLNVLFAVVCLFGPDPAKLWDAPGTPDNALLAWGAPLARALSIPAMGMAGAAWATIAARALVLVPMALIMVRRFDILPQRGSRSPDAHELKRIGTLAWPSSVQFVLRAAAALLVNSLVARFYTTSTDQTATTAMGLVFRVDTLAMFVAMGWGSAAQTFVGQNLGAKLVDRARRAGWIAALYDVFTNLVLWFLLTHYAAEVLLFFGKGHEAVEIGVTYLRIVAPSYIGLGTGIVLGNAIVASGAVRTTLLVDFGVIVLVQAPLSFVAVLTGDRSIERLFTCVSIAAAASAVVYMLVYSRGRWVSAADKLNQELRKSMESS